MRSDDVDVLQQLCDAATQWRDQALTKGVELNMLTTQIHEKDVFLDWDDQEKIWMVRAS